MSDALLAYIGSSMRWTEGARRSGVEGDQLRLLRDQASQPVLTYAQVSVEIRDQPAPEERSQATSVVRAENLSRAYAPPGGRTWWPMMICEPVVLQAARYLFQ
jgi:hypothetical protein